MSHGMELTPLERSSRNRPRLDAALAIYRKTVEAEARNPEKQILHWIDHSKESLSDEFRCFAIEEGGSVVGYLQFSFFNEERIIFLEYLCVQGDRKRGLVPSRARDAIRYHIETNYPRDVTIAFDVAHKQLPSGERIPDEKRLGYFRRLGFRRVDVNYHYPVLQSYDVRTSYSADLMVLLPNGSTTLTPSRMRTILRCIYFKHYLRWDRPFLNDEEFAERERLINELYSSQIAQIASKDIFQTYGDDRRVTPGGWISHYQPSVTVLLKRIFLPRRSELIWWIAVLLALQWLLGSVWALLPFVVVLVVIDCLAKDTKDSLRLLQVILAKFRVVGPQ
jgi:hypothetical protein